MAEWYVYRKKQKVERYPYFSFNGSPVMTSPIDDKIYVTDIERDLTFYGSIVSFTESKDVITVSLTDVKVYEYSSSNYLFSESEISFSRPKGLLHIEKTR